MKQNLDIRANAKSKRVHLWEIADKLGIQDSGLSRKLRKELPQAEKEAIFKAIDEIAVEKKKAV